MRSLSTVGLALSLVFGCLLLALVAELYYLLWCKNRVYRRDIDDNDDYINPSRELFHKFCFEKPLFFSSKALNPQQVCSSTLTHEPQTLVEEYEFMRLTPRFLYTIQEETKEDLEIEEGKKSRKGSTGSISSLSDVLFINGDETPYVTPFMTPIASPPYYTPPLTPLESIYKYNGFNPLFESTTNEAEFCKLRSSPPPKFKFLKDAEDKLFRKKLMEKAIIEKSPSTSSLFIRDEKTGSFITLIVAKDTEKEKELNLYGQL